MAIFLFILILGALIFVHELGHFLFAKKNHIRVDEFALGFPPRLISFKKGETRYSLNLIPFGGYVKIFGENPDEESLDPKAQNSFVNKPRLVQASVLVAGVLFNILFAWFLFFIVLMSGMPAIATDNNATEIKNVELVVTSIYPNSPAEKAGLEPGDRIVSISNQNENYQNSLKVQDVQKVIKESSAEIKLLIERKGSEIEKNILPEKGIVGDDQGIGISMDRIGVQKLAPHKAFTASFGMVVDTLKQIFVGFGKIIKGIFDGNGNFNQVSGPVGIVKLVNSASQFGWANLFAFTAMLSLNLAVLNILPFPALDGGRLLFLGIESIARKKIKPSVANLINVVGFFILIGLMVVVTVSDIIKIF